MRLRFVLLPCLVAFAACSEAKFDGSSGPARGDANAKAERKKKGDKDDVDSKNGNDGDGGADQNDGDDEGNTTDNDGRGDGGIDGDVELGTHSTDGDEDDATGLIGEDFEEACRKRKTKTKNITLDFPSNWGHGCPAVGTHGNKPRIRDDEALKHLISARDIQSQDIEVDGVLCGVEIETAVAGGNQSWMFDDGPVFVMDGYYLASWGATPELMVSNYGMDKDGDLVKFQFEKMIYKTGGGQLKADCPEGAKKCAMPVSQTTGPFEIDIPSKWFGKLPKAVKKQKKHVLELQILGNQNDPNDCSHTGLSLKAKVTYIK